jgi:4-alpha-glucanotransferase
MSIQEAWRRVGKTAHHGITVHLAALRTQTSSGIGEYLDLLPLIDWCHAVGLGMIQLLPLNDTGDDPSPYNPISSCALNPIYLSLSALPDKGSLEKDLAQFIPLRNATRIPLSSVRSQKMQWLRLYFERTFNPNDTGYAHFLESHPWVKHYALFCALKELHHQQSWQTWKSHSAPDPTTIQFHSYLQYLCHRQLTTVRKQADRRSLLLFGDVPILVSPDSADVWSEPHLFDLSAAAGAPPDMYNQKGQKWGFPLFQWNVDSNQGFAWWKRRLTSVSEYFHMYRIDHVVGFFRIWAVPKGLPPDQGHFVPSDPTLWPAQGRFLLEMMSSATDMLPIAEDLGTIPTFVPEILDELQICSTKILRWQKNSNGSYIPYSEYPPLSLTSVSTHDLDTTSEWWRQFPHEATLFARCKGWHYEPNLAREHLFEILRDSHSTSSFFHSNLLQETLALFPELVHADPGEERFNVPGTQLPSNWTYRYRPFVEEIASHTGLREAFHTLISQRNFTY